MVFLVLHLPMLIVVKNKQDIHYTLTYQSGLKILMK